MVRTYGLTHISLKVKDVNRSSAFYHKVFGTKEMYRNDHFIQVQTEGSKDIIVFEQGKINKNKSGGINHFGFRLVNPDDINDVIKTVQDAGGKIKESGEFVPGEPYVFFYDPDGYEIEIWYEKLPDNGWE
ncbi:MAG: VOC family protein [Bacteroidota bacterium]|nr:VOC family protein [Bacteroidota bacterium]